MALSIGAVAAAAGISVQTLRHYDALGILRPSKRTSAGYRQYSSEDQAKLDVIRTLRELDFDLPTIGRLLRGKTSLPESAALQLRALEHQSRVIHRRMAVLRVFLERGDPLDTRRLKQLDALARLERQEQAGFLSAELDRRMGRATPAPLRNMLTRLAMIELPESATERQLDAWLELAELVTDPSFLAHYAERSRSADVKHARKTEDADQSRERIARVVNEAAMAKRDGVEPSSAKGVTIAKQWLRALALQVDRRDYASFGREMLAAIDTGRHAPERRFWELMAILRPEIARSPQIVAGDWLITATRTLLRPIDS
jgi:DNA-binding transcriptional MerR regulator